MPNMYGQSIYCIKNFKIVKQFYQSRIAFSTSFLVRKNEEEGQSVKLTDSCRTDNRPHTINQSRLMGDEIFYELKNKKIEELRRRGHNLYPSLFKSTCSIDSIRKQFNSLSHGEKTSHTEVVKGYITSVRRQSKKLYFIDIHECNKEEIKLQLVVNKEFFNNKEDFSLICDCLSRRDYIGAKGCIIKTSSGELSLKVNELMYITPCCQDLPLEGTLEKQAKRLSRRYVDLMTNKKSRQKFESRHKITKFIRDFLHKMDFIEVDTPILAACATGAVAKPFKTYFNHFEKNLHMRIAPELYLKKYVIGGFNRVFEISKQFRNESLDNTHHPEFTTCEFYMANSEYEELMEITEKMLSELVFSLFGKYEITYKPHSYSKTTIKLNFEPPFRRIDFMSSLEEKLNVTLPEASELYSEDSRNIFIELCRKHGVMIADDAPIQKLIDKLCDKVLVKDFVNPTFLINHPQIMSPFTKGHRNIAGLSERFELYVANLEICDAYSEQNDPFEQQRQIEHAMKSNDHKEDLDFLNEYVKALTFGLPPTGGWGMGIDRLVMILTNTNTIKDVIAFPLLAK